MRVCVLSHSGHVQLFVTPWTVACQAPLSVGFSKQECWSGLPFPPPGHLPNPGVEPESPVPPSLADGFFTTEPLGKPFCTWVHSDEETLGVGCLGSLGMGLVARGNNHGIRGLGMELITDCWRFSHHVFNTHYKNEHIKNNTHYF